MENKDIRQHLHVCINKWQGIWVY